MDKLTLAHSYMVEYVKSNGLDVTDLEVGCAFDIAEAMLAENEKRTDKTRPAVLDEFQVDWSQAPEWAVAWTFDKNGATWWSEMPVVHGNIWFVDYGIWQCEDAPSFDYQGNWKDSLRGRK